MPPLVTPPKRGDASNGGEDPSTPPIHPRITLAVGAVSTPRLPAAGVLGAGFVEGGGAPYPPSPSSSLGFWSFGRECGWCPGDDGASTRRFFYCPRHPWRVQPEAPTLPPSLPESPLRWRAPVGSSSLRRRAAVAGSNMQHCLPNFRRFESQFTNYTRFRPEFDPLKFPSTPKPPPFPLKFPSDSKYIRKLLPAIGTDISFYLFPFSSLTNFS